MTLFCFAVVSTTQKVLANLKNEVSGSVKLDARQEIDTIVLPGKMHFLPQFKILKNIWPCTFNK